MMVECCGHVSLDIDADKFGWSRMSRYVDSYVNFDDWNAVVSYEAASNLVAMQEC